MYFLGFQNLNIKSLEKIDQILMFDSLLDHIIKHLKSSWIFWILSYTSATPSTET